MNRSWSRGRSADRTAAYKARQEGRVCAGDASYRFRNHGCGGDGARRTSQQRSRALDQSAGGRAVGLTGQDGGFIRARKMLVSANEGGELRDIGQVGEIASIDPGIIETLETGGFIPVVAPSASAKTKSPTTSMPIWSPAGSPRCCAPRSSWCLPTHQEYWTGTASCSPGSRPGVSTHW